MNNDQTFNYLWPHSHDRTRKSVFVFHSFEFLNLQNVMYAVFPYRTPKNHGL